MGAGGLRSSAVRGCVGEHCGPESVRGALDTLGARRLAHGVRAIEDGALVARLAAERVCCDTCPTSNVMLRVVPSMASHPLRYAILLITTWCRVRGAMLLQAALQGNEIGYTSFDVHGKNAPVQFSTDPKISVFLLNVQKAAAGLTLTAATHVFLVEPLLNPGRS